MFTMPTINMLETGKRIMELRMDAGMSVKDLQDIFGFTTPNAIYKWQHGTALPTLDNLVILAAVFDVAIDDIVVLDTDIAVQISA
ncbi:MAG: helix-turn-helix domain-containing protein [Lachnospiraceae bacterium]|nr:helix-turn-helix domain-containing protein [Lachnospiraceae bacterium]